MVVLMALDHVRTFWYQGLQSPLDLTNTSPGLFMTRWITHLCAPLFFLLSGMSIYFLLKKCQSKKRVSKVLILRGLLLILFEILIFSKIWIGEEGVILLQVLWALGCAMITMAVLIWLKDWMIWLFSLSQILGHNLLQESTGKLWSVFHIAHSNFQLLDTTVVVLYPLIPWLGVMSLGYLLGKLMNLETKNRIKWLTGIGSASIVLFVFIRYSNSYGDPSPWQIYDNGLVTFLSFINCEKYPPSLLFLLITLGLGFLMLGLLEWLIEKGGTKYFKLLELFGKVPLFFYLIHLPVILILKLVLAIDGVNLMGVYGAWGATLAILYPVCKGYLVLKSNEKWSVLHYI